MKKMVLRFFPMITGFVAAVFLITGASLAQEDQPQLTVVELFTSQSCPRSPAGDKNLAMISARADVLALTFPVTYWDYLGWVDTFARDAFDERQKFYTERLKDQWLYTPQAVVQGQKGVSGEDIDAIEVAIADLPRTSWRVPTPRRSADRSTLTLITPAMIGRGNTSLQVVFFERGPVTVEVTSGKNAGKTLSYVNVVRSLLTVDTDSVAIPESLQGLSCAVLLQDTLDGTILGASLCPA